jgi:hypothetical protein
MVAAVPLLFVDGHDHHAQEIRRIVPGLHFELAILPSGHSASAPETEQQASDKLLRCSPPAACFSEAIDLQTVDGRSLRLDLDSENENRFCRWFRNTAVTLRLSVAVRPPGAATPALITATCDGVIAETPAGERHSEWYRLFVPDGYRSTLAELVDAGLLIGPRVTAYTELARVLEVPAQMFEAHLRVAAVAPAAFTEACDELGLRALGLRDGSLSTASYHGHSLERAQGEAFALVRDLAARTITTTELRLTRLDSVRSSHEIFRACPGDPGWRT